MRILNRLFIVFFLLVHCFDKQCHSALQNNEMIDDEFDLSSIRGFPEFKRINLTSGILIISQIDSPLKRKLTVSKNTKNETVSNLASTRQIIIGDCLYLYANGGVGTNLLDSVTYTLETDSIEEIIVSGHGAIIIQGWFSNVFKDLSINLCGNGSVQADNIMVKSLTLNLAGRGEINIGSLYCTSLQTKICGTGTITIKKGCAHSQTVFISGKGGVFTHLLNGENGEVEITGDGGAFINIKTSLKVKAPTISDVTNIGMALMTFTPNKNYLYPFDQKEDNDSEYDEDQVIEEIEGGPLT